MADNPVNGVLAQHWMANEAAYDTVAAFSASEGADIISMEITPSKAHEEINSHIGTGSPQSDVPQEVGGTWTVATHLRPAALGTAPDIDPLLIAAMGLKAINAGVSTAYSLTDNNTPGVGPIALGAAASAGVYSAQFGKYVTDNFAEWVNGAWCEQVELDATGGKSPILTFSGGFASYGYLKGEPTISSGTGTTLTMTTGHGKKLGIGALVKIGTEDNSGAGYRVTAKTADSVTISPTLAGAVSGSDIVAPVFPSHTVTGSPIGGVEHALTIDAVSVGLIASKFSFSTGIKALARRGSSAKPLRISREEGRKLTGTHDVYTLDETAGIIGGAWDSELLSSSLRVGPTSGDFLFSMDANRFDVVPTPMSDTEAAVTALTHRSEQAAAAADELILVVS